MRAVVIAVGGMVAMLVVVMALVDRDDESVAASATATADAGVADAASPPDADPRVVADHRADRFYQSIDDFVEAGKLVRARRAMDQLVAEQPQRRTEPAYRKRLARLDGAVSGLPPEGWRNVTWGMSRGDVVELYPGGVGGSRSYDVETSFFDKRTRVVFRFQDNRLARVEIVAPLGDTGPAELVELLSEKYGEPSAGTRSDTRLWYTPATRIELVGGRFGKGVLRYHSLAIPWTVGESDLTRERKLRDL